MEFKVIESEALEMVLNSVNSLIEVVYTELNEGKKKFDEEWVDATELSTILGISPKTLQNYKRRGLIGHSSIGHRLYFKRTEVLKILKPKINKEGKKYAANNKK
jgi:hypothetical protein